MVELLIILVDALILAYLVRRLIGAECEARDLRKAIGTLRLVAELARERQSFNVDVDFPKEIYADATRVCHALMFLRQAAFGLQSDVNADREPISDADVLRQIGKSIIRQIEEGRE